MDLLNNKLSEKSSKFSNKDDFKSQRTDSNQLVSLVYHDIFDYPLNSSELFEWKVGQKLLKIKRQIAAVESSRGYYFLEGRKELVRKRKLRENISKEKRITAKKAARLIKIIPTVKMAGITGALAMNNASEASDVDLMIIAQKGYLWTTRGLVWILLKLMRRPIRRPNKKEEKNKLCLNIWLDESDLKWRKRDRNIYTAHEIAQIVPLVNKDNSYEKFISKNRWIKDFWPNAVEVTKLSSYQVNRRKKDNFIYLVTQYLVNLVAKVIEKVAFRLQYAYMRKKITRETITPTRALFHPVDWSGLVLSRMSNQKPS